MNKHDNFMDKLTTTEQDKLYREIVKFEQQSLLIYSLISINNLLHINQNSIKYQRLILLFQMQTINPQSKVTRYRVTLDFTVLM